MDRTEYYYIPLQFSLTGDKNKHIIMSLAVCEISDCPTAKCYEELWWAIDFQLSVAQNGHELNACIHFSFHSCFLV